MTDQLPTDECLHLTWRPHFATWMCAGCGMQNRDPGDRKEDAQARFSQLLRAFTGLEAELDSATTRGRELVQQAETYAQIAETRVQRLAEENAQSEARVRELEEQIDKGALAMLDDAKKLRRLQAELSAEQGYRMQAQAELARLTPLVADSSALRERLEERLKRAPWITEKGQRFIWEGDLRAALEASPQGGPTAPQADAQLAKAHTAIVSSFYRTAHSCPILGAYIDEHLAEQGVVQEPGASRLVPPAGQTGGCPMCGSGLTTHRTDGSWSCGSCGKWF